MNKWIRKTETKNVFLPLAAFKCPKCGKAVIAFDENANDNIQPRIKDYKFCPYCGCQIIIERREVVRCKDCIHNGHCGTQFQYADCNENWFCADGERRTDDA